MNADYHSGHKPDLTDEEHDWCLTLELLLKGYEDLLYRRVSKTKTDI